MSGVFRATHTEGWLLLVRSCVYNPGSPGWEQCLTQDQLIGLYRAERHRNQRVCVCVSGTEVGEGRIPGKRDPSQKFCLKVKTPPLSSRDQFIIHAKALLENRGSDPEPSLGSFFWNGKQGRLWPTAGASCSCAQIRFPGKEAAAFVKAPLKPERRTPKEPETKSPEKTV